MEVTLKGGDKVRVKSREWFDKNCTLSSDGDYMYSFKNGGTEIFKFRIYPSMLEFCGKIVTITDIAYSDIIKARILEDGGRFWWLKDFFECVYYFDTLDLVTSIESYCQRYCVLKENDVEDCKISDCPFYKKFKKVDL